MTDEKEEEPSSWDNRPGDQHTIDPRLEFGFFVIAIRVGVTFAIR